jgi:cell division protein FtsN
LARNDEGEFELVLGNLQLISVFLIVVILLGVFFSMGYIVGRNSAPPAIADARTSPPGKPIVVEPPTRASRDPDQPATSAAQPAPTEPAAQPTAPETKPVHNPPAVEKKEAVRSEPPPTQAPPEKKPEVTSARGAVTAVDRPAAGRYWQVVSTSRPEAEIIAGAIAKKGLKSIVAPAPKDGYYRVLVGPLEDPSEIAKTRSELESAGFKNPILQKY